jgi:endonuclease/exonuclease/phosphatase (EEP) superfamily protein YafD
VLLIRREYRAFASFALFAAINLGTIAPLYLLATPAPSPPVGPSHRALLSNVNKEAGNPEKVAKLIQVFDPDIVLLEEVSDEWMADLATPLARYSYSKAMPRDDNFGIALYSKYSFIAGEIRFVGDAEIPSVIAEIQMPEGRFTIIGTHPLPPAGGENTRLRNGQLASLSVIVRQAQSPVLLLGDLNATPWCFAYRRLLRDSGLIDSSAGRGVQPTWPTFMPLLLIPIDQCLHSPAIHVTRKTIGPNVGSDHYPLIVDFALRKR